MGVNYKLKTDYCECCHRSRERHIGKSSYGWAFALHIYPEDGINTLDDWTEEFRKGMILDEDGQEVSKKEMLDIITKRNYGNGSLLRAKIDGEFCIGRGEGPWDYMIGWFC